MIARDYAELREIPVQKDFALRALKTVCPAALFALRAGHADTVATFFSTANIDFLMRLLREASNADTL